MKKISKLQHVCCCMLGVVAVTLLSIGQTKAQLVNVNPEPNGEPWMAGGVPDLTSDRISTIEAVPQLTYSSSTLKHLKVNYAKCY